MSELIYSNSVYGPEANLALWLTLSFVALTVSLLFYHMAKTNSVELDYRISGLFAIALIGVSVAYTAFAIVPYLTRINSVIRVCKHDDSCDERHIRELYRIRNTFVGLSTVTVATELGIALIIAFSTAQSMMRKR
jgi:hypothetical protein